MTRKTSPTTASRTTTRSTGEGAGARRPLGAVRANVEGLEEVAVKLGEVEAELAVLRRRPDVAKNRLAQEGRHVTVLRIGVGLVRAFRVRRLGVSPSPEAVPGGLTGRPGRLRAASRIRVATPIGQRTDTPIP